MTSFQVDGSIGADVSGFIRDLRECVDVMNEAKRAAQELNDALDELDNKHVKVKVEIEGHDEITRLKEDLDKLTEEPHEIKVNVSADQDAITRLREDLERLNSTGNTVVDVRVNITGADALERLRLDIDRLTLTRHVVRIDVDTGSAVVQLAALRTAINGVQSSARDGESATSSFGEALGGGGGGLMGIILLLIPAVAALGTVTTGVAAGLLGAFSVLGVGIGGFALFAIPTITKVNKVLQDLGKNTAASSAEWKSLSEPMKIAVTNLKMFKDTYAKISDMLQVPVLKVFAAGLNLAQAGMLQLAKVAKPTADALAPLLQEAAEGISSGGMSKFFDYVAKEIPWFLNTWGHAVGNFVTGIFTMLQAFDPLSKFVSKGFLGMSESFLKWSQQLSGSKGFQNFVQFVIANGPKVMNMIGQLVKTIAQLVYQLSPFGMQIIGQITAVLKWASAFAQAHPQIAELAIKLAVLVAIGMQLWPVISGLVAAIGALSAPVIAVIAVVALIVAAIVVWWNKCATFRDFVKDMWAKIVAWFKDGIADAKKQIDDILPLIVALWNKYGKSIMAIVTGVWQVISSIIRGAMDIIFGIIKVVLGLLTGNWKAVWNGLGTIVKGAWTIIKGAVMGLYNILKGELSQFITMAENMGTAIVRGLWNGIQGAAGWLKNQFEGLLNDIRGMLPFSPAKYGPFSGSGWVTYSGAAIVDGLAEGINSRKSAIMGTMNVLTTLVHAALPNTQNMGSGGAGQPQPLNNMVMAGMASSGGQSAVFQPGAIQINNPTAEPTSDSLGKTMTRISKFGIFETG